jgi:hypothetical protein
LITNAIAAVVIYAIGRVVIIGAVLPIIGAVIKVIGVIIKVVRIVVEVVG